MKGFKFVKELRATIVAVVQLTDSAYVEWLQRFLRILARRRWSRYGFVPGADEFHPLLHLHDASEEQFDKVLCGISALRLRWSTTQPMHQRGSARADNTDLVLDDLTAEFLAKIYE